MCPCYENRRKKQYRGLKIHELARPCPRLRPTTGDQDDDQDHDPRSLAQPRARPRPRPRNTDGPAVSLSPFYDGVSRENVLESPGIISETRPRVAPDGVPATTGKIARNKPTVFQFIYENLSGHVLVAVKTFNDSLSR
ncbi:uncharacterized protein LOC144475792 [Augochlora pura]